MTLIFWRSEDGGKTWQTPVEVTRPGIHIHSYQDVLLRTSCGRIVYPVYVTVGQDSKPHDRTGKLVNGQWIPTGAHFFESRYTTIIVFYSDDDGRTWKRNRDGELVILLDRSAYYSFCSEPTVAEVSPGRLLMVMRTGLGRIFQAWSDDNGETWTRHQPTSLAVSTAPARIRTLPNGHLLVVWNQETEEEVRIGYNRTRLSSAISRNGTVNISNRFTIMDDGPTRRCSL